jgi:hypothetical protein
MTVAPLEHGWQAALRLAHAVARCGARGKRTGQPCQGPAMANGRCRVHGGKSTGPKTPEGAERARQAALRHGFYTAELKAERRNARAVLFALRAVLGSTRPE